MINIAGRIMRTQPAPSAFSLPLKEDVIGRKACASRGLTAQTSWVSWPGRPNVGPECFSPGANSWDNLTLQTQDIWASSSLPFHTLLEPRDILIEREGKEIQHTWRPRQGEGCRRANPGGLRGPSSCPY